MLREALGLQSVFFIMYLLHIIVLLSAACFKRSMITEVHIFKLLNSGFVFALGNALEVHVLLLLRKELSHAYMI